MRGVYLVCFPFSDLASPSLSTPLYARTSTDIAITGEDALANLSIEKTSDGTISGFVRIRSRSQGLALSLGSLKGLKAGTY